MSSLLFETGSPDAGLSGEDMRQGLHAALDSLGERTHVCVIPPDITRYHSRAGELTRYAYEYYGERLTDVLPALGTHTPMSDAEWSRMFGDVPRHLARPHDWRHGITTLGDVPGSYVRDVSEGCVDYAWPAQIDRLLVEQKFDLILSIGQIVPHEVAGMANFNKNIFVGTGGVEGINKSHYLGAAYGMERIMGRADNPVRRVLNYAENRFASHLPIVYVHTVLSPDTHNSLTTRGLFIGPDVTCFHRAAALSEQVNIEKLPDPLAKVVVYLDPDEYRSTWLGNKAIYRTRMAIADGGELIVLAPGVAHFGEDEEIDRLIRKYGYRGTPYVQDAVARNEELQNNLSAAAHLIHGSSEDRFSITYCPGGCSREEIESVNYRYAPVDEMLQRYAPTTLQPGYNTLPDGEEIYFISNPGLGLWTHEKKFSLS
jgi:nickel-dependent lactate racemase